MFRNNTIVIRIIHNRFGVNSYPAGNHHVSH
nr:MAG TPA: hypothetical protein [Caudoviricetes sp.]